MSSLVEGIIIGVISCAIFALIVFAIKSFLYPLIKNLFSDIPDISGEWKLYYSKDAGGDAVGFISLKQNFSNLSGSGILFKNRDGHIIQERKLLLRGWFKGGQVFLFYENPELKGYISGVVLFLLLNQKLLSGQAMYRHPSHSSGNIKSYDLSASK